MDIRIDGSCPMGDAAHAGLRRPAYFHHPTAGVQPASRALFWCFAQSKRTRAAFVFILVATTLSLSRVWGLIQELTTTFRFFLLYL
jgi:hypothetical protein